MDQYKMSDAMIDLMVAEFDAMLDLTYEELEELYPVDEYPVDE